MNCECHSWKSWAHRPYVSRQAALLDEARHSLLSGGTGTAPLGALLCSIPNPSHSISCSWGFPLQPQNTTHLFSKQNQLFTEAVSKVSVQPVNFPSHWQVLGNNKPRQLTRPSLYVLTTAFANPFKKTQMVFWGRDKVFQTWNWLLQLSLASDQTQSSLKAPLNGHSQQTAKGVRPAGYSQCTEPFIKFIILAWRPSARSWPPFPALCT